MLKSLKDYQQQASSLIESIKKKNKDLQIIIIEKDLKSFATANNLTIDNNNVKYEGSFKLKLLSGTNDNPSLEIKDLRKPTFLWIYDVIVDFDFPGYRFDHNGKSYDLRFVYEDDFAELKDDIIKYLDLLNKSLEALNEDLKIVNSEGGLINLNYSYRCSNPEVSVKDINDAMKIAKLRRLFGD